MRWAGARFLFVFGGDGASFAVVVRPMAAPRRGALQADGRVRAVKSFSSSCASQWRRSAKSGLRDTT